MELAKAFPSVVDYAVEIVQMHQKIERLESEVESLLYYRNEYFKLCDDTVKQSNKLFDIMLTASIGDFETAQAIAES